MERMIMANNNVLTITKENFEEEVTNSAVPVLIDFWATWCAPCRMLSPTIESLADDMTGKIKVGKINVDEQPELASAFRVSSIPTVNLVKGNSIIMQSIGVKPKETLRREIEAKIQVA
jgi:thioredoxin 1